jgi:hypothetical protein
MAKFKVATEEVRKLGNCLDGPIVRACRGDLLHFLNRSYDAACSHF